MTNKSDWHKEGFQKPTLVRNNPLKVVGNDSSSEFDTSKLAEEVWSVVKWSSTNVVNIFNKKIENNSQVNESKKLSYRLNDHFNIVNFDEVITQEQVDLIIERYSNNPGFMLMTNTWHRMWKYTKTTVVWQKSLKLDANSYADYKLFLLREYIKLG